MKVNPSKSKKAIIAKAIKNMPAEIDFSDEEIDQLYNLGIEWRNNSLSKKELIVKISNLRGRSFVYIVNALELLGAIITLLINDFNPIQMALFHLISNGYMEMRSLEIISDTEKGLGHKISQPQE